MQYVTFQWGKFKRRVYFILLVPKPRNSVVPHSHYTVIMTAVSLQTYLSVYTLSWHPANNYKVVLVTERLASAATTPSAM